MRLAVAGLLLILATGVTVTYVLYPWVTSLFERMKYSFTDQALFVDSKDINATHITATLRNVGNKDVTLTKAYIDDRVYIFTQDVVIPTNSIGTVYLLGVYTPGKEYNVELVATSGYFVKFNIKYEQQP